jgi:hypothetical protein
MANTVNILRQEVQPYLRNGRPYGSAVINNSVSTGGGGGTGIGVSGYSGYSGIGLSGYSGIDGVVGSNGASGYSGYSGLNGEAAMSGYSGIDGLSGYSGASTSGYSGYSGQSGTGASGYYGMFLNSTNQIYTSNDTTEHNEFLVKFDTTVEANGISISEDTKIVFAHPNVYSITAELHFGNGGSSLNYWLKKNGTNIPETLSKFGASSIKDTEIQWMVTTTDPNDYYEIAWSHNFNGYDTVGLFGSTGNTNPTRPSYPSSQVNIQQVMFLAASVSGASGYSGASTSGYSGYSGNGGLSGYSGIDGFSGSDGASGYSGTNGTNGTNGASGYSGINGTSGYSGSSPSGVTDPDFYYDTATDTLHTPNEVISGVLTYIDGNQASGYVLTSDANGVAHWTAGGAGTSGYSGYSGNGGLSGYSGIDGISGTNGTNGSDGASGYSGYSGNGGLSGYSGAGESGYSGYSGKNGKPGDVGEQGLSGYSGQSNVSGYSGYSGITGADGLSGYSGIGVSGYSGTQGLSGYSGATGAAGGVTYVGLSMPSIFNVSGTPVTSSGTIGVNLNTEPERTFFAGDTLGNGYAVPAFRTIVASDLPTLPYDNYVAWKFTAGGTDVPINSTGSTGTYRGVEFVEGDGIQFGLASNINNQVRLTISSYGISGAGASGFSGYSGKSGYSGSNGSAGTSGYSGLNGSAASSGYSGYSGIGGTGTSGYSGATGAQGYSGYSGSASASNETIIGRSGTISNNTQTVQEFLNCGTLEANSTYFIEGYFLVWADAATTGCWISFGSNSTGFHSYVIRVPLTNTTEYYSSGEGWSGEFQTATSTVSASTVRWTSIVNTTGSTGTLTFNFRSEVNASAVYVGAGSSVIIKKIQ